MLSLVTREDLEVSLEKAHLHVTHTAEGLYGPGSLTWEVNREAVVLLGGGAAALLQVAHPFVAHGVGQHSRVVEDMQGRFRRTFESVFALTFGTWPEAVDTARRIHTVHTFIRGELEEDLGRFRAGEPYAANDVSALYWVHATLIVTATRLFEVLVRPLTSTEKDRLLQESHLFSYMFGVPDAHLPSSWRGFEDYMGAMIDSGDIAVGRHARRIAHHLLAPPPNRPHLRPLFGWLAFLTSWLLPPRLRVAFDLPLTPARERLVKAGLLGVRASLPLLPPSVRCFPGYLDSSRRLDGKPPHPFGRLFERLATAVLLEGRDRP